jgi:hypothetical protein
LLRIYIEEYNGTWEIKIHTRTHHNYEHVGRLDRVKRACRKIRYNIVVLSWVVQSITKLTGDSVADDIPTATIAVGTEMEKNREVREELRSSDARRRHPPRLLPLLK